LREEFKLRVFENRYLKCISGTKREAKCEWRRLYFIVYTVHLIKARRLNLKGGR
jgi:hypothetical protein